MKNLNKFLKKCEQHHFIQEEWMEYEAEYISCTISDIKDICEMKIHSGKNSFRLKFWNENGNLDKDLCEGPGNTCNYTFNWEW